MRFNSLHAFSCLPALLAAAIGFGSNVDAVSQSVRIRPGTLRSLNARNVGQALLTEKSLPAIAKLKPTPEIPDTVNVSSTAPPETEAPSMENVALDLSSQNSFTLGDYTVSIPKCVTIKESGPDFILGSYRADIDVDAWIFNESYKISTPDAYINHLKRSVTRIESSANRGALREISGYDAPTDRNFYVALIPDGKRFYVVRLRFKPSLTEQIQDKIIPNLIN